MQSDLSIPHLRRHGEAQQLIVDGDPFIMLAGEIHNSSSSSLAYMEPIWDRLKDMRLNTVIAPLYWELVEPEEGHFDFHLVDGLIEGARKRGLRLVLLWFASWKNAASSYVPGWVKSDLERFPRLQLAPGQNANALSCFGVTSREADARAFAALMRHIREVDHGPAGTGPHTVIAMQVENECGVLGAPRDVCPLAEEAFAQPVPEALTAYLRAHRDSLVPQFRESWESAGARATGSWEEVFGNAAVGGAADEVFMAWHISRYVGSVAAAGKAAYDLPMVANAWLKVGPTEPAGFYPSGGPVYTMLDVWKAGAPQIDVLAPDIYALDFCEVCAAYTRPDNPLFIPEAHRDARAATAAFYALAQHSAIGFAPFGIDSAPQPHPLADTYQLLAEMMPLLTERQGARQMVGFLQQQDDEQWQAELAGYHLTVQARSPLLPEQAPAGGMVLDVGEGEYVVAGRNMTVEFGTAPGRTDVEFLWLEEGTFCGGTWMPGRRLNGDETTHGRKVQIREKLGVCRLKLNRAAGSIQHQERMPF
jgi:beta-galactosidase GanA